MTGAVRRQIPVRFPQSCLRMHDEVLSSLPRAATTNTDQINSIYCLPEDQRIGVAAQ